MNIQEERDFINELNTQVSPIIGEWAQGLLSEGQTIKEVKEAMRRMVDIASKLRD